MKILFVCTGNSCRSPMAELYFNHLARKHNTTLSASSAGIYANDGGMISRAADGVMRELGIETADFRSTLSSFFNCCTIAAAPVLPTVLRIYMPSVDEANFFKLSSFKRLAAGVPLRSRIKPPLPSGTGAATAGSPIPAMISGIFFALKRSR